MGNANPCLKIPAPEGMKWCTRHDNKKGKLLPLDEFNNISRGLRYWCKDCWNAYKRLPETLARERPSKWLSLRTHFDSTKSAAKRRGLPFELTFEQWESIVTKPCIYGGGKRPEFKIGIDRLDHVNGYTIHNSLPCCFFHNSLRSDIFTSEEVHKVLEVVYKPCGNHGVKYQ